jgi:hypothetical protein
MVRVAVPTAAIALCALPLMLEGCDRSPQMAVDRLVPDIERLNGKRVTAIGYLPECLGYECRLFANEADARRAATYFTELRSARRPSFEPMVKEPIWLGIGVGKNMKFDEQAKPFVGGYVRVTGIVTNRCRFHGHPACSDRSTDIEPDSIEAGRRSQ